MSSSPLSSSPAPARALFGFESDLAGLRELADAAPDLRRSKRWFSGAAEPKTASDLEGWRGVSYGGSGSSGRVTELELQVAGASVPDGLCRLTALQSLTVASSSLEALPDGIGACAQLKSLKLSNCPRLAKLPDGVGGLKQLRVLDLSGCKGVGAGRPVALPRTLGDLSALETLKLSGCEGLSRLPLEICNLSALATLELQGCSSLTTLPMKLADLPKLKKLDVRGCIGVNADPTKGVLGRLAAAGCTVLA